MIHLKSPSPILVPRRCSTSTGSSPLSSLPPPHTHCLWMQYSRRISQLRRPGIEFIGQVLVLPSTKTRTSSLCGLGLRRGWVHHPRLPVSGRPLPVLGTGAGPPPAQNPPHPPPGWSWGCSISTSAAEHQDTEQSDTAFQHLLIHSFNKQRKPVHKTDTIHSSPNISITFILRLEQFDALHKHELIDDSQQCCEVGIITTLFQR